MRRLVFVMTVACLATLATGCIISSDDDDVVDDTGLITADWSFHNVTGAATGCPAGFDTASVTAEPTDNSQPVVDLYDCVDMHGTADYPINAYDVTIDITSRSGGTVYNVGAPTQRVDIVPADATVQEDFIDDGGRFILDWVLVDATNAQMTCAEAGATKIGLTGTLAGGGAPFDDDLPCTDGIGISLPAPSGAYTLAIQALNSAGAGLGQSTVKTGAAATIDEPNGYTDLGSVTIVAE